VDGYSSINLFNEDELILASNKQTFVIQNELQLNCFLNPLIVVFKEFKMIIQNLKKNLRSSVENRFLKTYFCNPWSLDSQRSFGPGLFFNLKKLILKQGL
jgi:hypothetical protein